MNFKLVILFFFSSALLLLAAEKADPKRAANTVVLDALAVKNLGIQTIEVEENTFDETVFALGMIEVLPGKKAIVSSRIAGRAFSVLALPDQEVDEGEELMWVESRLPGDPPPTVMLAAPIAGSISKVSIAVGQPIEPNSELIEIVDLTQVEASARVPQALAGKLAKDQVAHIRVSAFPDKVFEAKLAHLGIYADEKSGTIEAAFHVANPEKLLRPGMRAEFSIVVSQRENVMSVPRSALQGDATNRFVYVEDFDLKNAFVKSPVEVGEINTHFAEIKSGLFPGDNVVSAGGYSLSFAGKGSVSLKEALDAAHGHEHNADGSEKTSTAKGEEDHDHEHEHGETSNVSNLTKFSLAANALLLVLLIVAMLRKPNAVDEAQPNKKAEDV